jgi:hypothetical protein
MKSRTSTASKATAASLLSPVVIADRVPVAGVRAAPEAEVAAEDVGVTAVAAAVAVEADGKG